MTAWCQNCNGLIAQRDQAQRDERRWRKLLLEERKARDTARAEAARLAARCAELEAEVARLRSQAEVSCWHCGDVLVVSSTFPHCERCPSEPADCDAAEAHHPRQYAPGLATKAPDDTVIAICSRHHRDLHALTGPFKGWSRARLQAWERERVAEHRAMYEGRERRA